MNRGYAIIGLDNPKSTVNVGATLRAAGCYGAAGVYVFGAEDTTLGSRVLSWCRDRVFVPTASCMNLAACVNVVLYDRTAKAILSGAQIGKRRPTLLRVMGGTAEVMS